MYTNKNNSDTEQEKVSTTNIANTDKNERKMCNFVLLCVAYIGFHSTT